MSTGISILLIGVGAVLTFALEREAEGINLNTVGIIMMIVGLLGLAVSALFWSSWGPYNRERRRTTIVDRQDQI
jgi:Domain of unknown function (DUF6458)